MIKIKEDYLTRLVDFGFRPKYDIDTGEISRYYLESIGDTYKYSVIVPVDTRYIDAVCSNPLAIKYYSILLFDLQYNGFLEKEV